jgi:hypothetical protein
MAPSFRIYRVLCSTPPDLEAEREIFESTLTSFGEAVAFPQKVLFAPASFLPPFDAGIHRTAVEANVRECDFFLHVFGESWPGPPFPAFIDLAQDSMAAPARPLRRSAILFKNFARADEKVREFRDKLGATGKFDLRDFQETAELDGMLREIFSSWWESLRGGLKELGARS